MEVRLPPRAQKTTEKGGLAERLMRGTRNAVGAIPYRFESCTHRQFTISAFWVKVASALRASAGARSVPKPHFATLCHAPRGEKETAWFWIWKFAERSSDKMKFYYQSFFVSPKAKHGSDNFNILTALI
jgi:hypothetical protein